MQENTVLGIDGCRSGWIVAAINLTTGKVQLNLFPSIADLWSTYHTSCQLALIDIPIGLVDAGANGRSCDQLARRMLSPHRHSSIFTPPCRAALYTSPEQASAVNFQYTGKRLSMQTINIMPKMREVDECLLQLPATDRARIKESHPEVVFCALNHDRPMVHNKKKATGRLERINHLKEIRTDIDEILKNSRSNIPAKDAAMDDLIDALALAFVAEIVETQPGRMRQLPEQPQHDSEQLPIHILYAAANN